VTAILIATVVAGVTGSLHCAAMCGPFAAASHHLPAYALGRLVAYLALGVLAGGLGAALELAAIGRVALPLAGVVVIVWGGVSLLRALGARRASGAAGPRAPMLYAIHRRRPWTRGALIGALTPLLPCGWLWAFVVVAAGTGSAASGAGVMAALWLGSAPAIAGAGLTLRALGRRLGPRLPVITACAQIAIGVLTLALRAPVVDAPPPRTPSEASCH
jgi:sulfite exporter TauE/SafE